MISVSDRQLRIVAAAADLLPSEARGTLLQTARRWPSCTSAVTSATATLNKRCGRRCSISQRRDLLNPAGYTYSRCSSFFSVAAFRIHGVPSTDLVPA